MYCKETKENGEACSKLATEDGQYCKYHQDKNNVSSFFKNRDRILRKNWDSIMSEIKEKNSQSSLSQIIDYWHHKVTESGINVSRKYLVDWYLNLDSEGHPVQIIKNSSLINYYAKYPYLFLLENGFPKTDDEIVKEYLAKNPEARVELLSQPSHPH